MLGPGVECPGCGRQVLIPAARRTANSRCFYCGSPLRFPDASPPEIDEPPAEATCLICGRVQRRKPVDDAGCMVCGFPFEELSGAAENSNLWEVFAPPLQSDVLVTLIERALESRWRAGTVSRAEVGEALAWLERLARWSEGWREGAAISPLPPELTGELARRRILGIPSALFGRTAHGGAAVRVFQGDFNSIASEVLQGALRAALVIGLAIATRSSHIASLFVNDDDKPGDPSIVLEFEPCLEGSVLSAYRQDGYGRVSALDSAQAGKMAAAIRNEIGPRALSYIAFRSLYGRAATLTVQEAAAVDRVANRIRSLCPSLALGADELARRIVAG